MTITSGGQTPTRLLHSVPIFEDHMAGSDHCDFERLTDFRDHGIMNVSLKTYPCCSWIHTTLDALGELIAENQFNSLAVACSGIIGGPSLMNS